MAFTYGQNRPLSFSTKGGLFGFGSKTYDGGLLGTRGAAFFDSNNNFIGLGDGNGGIRTSNGLVGMNSLGAGSWMDTGSGDKFFLDSGGKGGFGGLGGLGDILGAGAGILQGLAGLRQAQIAEQQLGLAKKQFGFQKGVANRNIANQAKTINNMYDNAGQVAAGMIGGTDANGNYGFTDQAIVDRYAQSAREKHVDGSAIG